ncbi:ketosteroid isomerase-like protein [Mycobacterium sp. MAA66]|uniref:nuclear transport factor 2 family protein n=1 Tax=Mycobacterium sp. MAA66 TaxID=3156297 RepID=UPI003518EDB7
MTSVEELVARLQNLEDERDIAHLIASYGPLVDAGDADGVAARWAEDGGYDVEGWQMTSRADVHAMVNSTGHQGLVASGCCHFLGPAVVTVSGDTAVAVCESLVVVRRDTQFVVWRAAANHFQLSRTAGSWQIAARKSRLLNGSGEGHGLLTAGVAGRAAD